jgi:thioester reductase-like protein
MEADTRLPPDIGAASCAPPSPAIRAVFLTGATGFLGAFLLHELLEQTNAAIHCLVRCESPEEGIGRLEATLRKYERWNDRYRDRLAVVRGDLGADRFGLTYEAFERLARDVDAVYHNGALVNFVSPYRRLRSPNVGGTLEVLRLASRTRLKPVHYVSTMDVLGAEYYNLGEEDEVARAHDWGTGYAQSKWVAERLVAAARERGLPIAVYRPARIVGDTRTGIWNTDDFACRAIKGLVQLGAAPIADPVDNMSPVDVVARAIVRISRDPRATAARAFHLVHPQWFLWGRMFDFIRARGYALEALPYPHWWRRLVDACAAGDDNALKPLVPLFPVPPDPMPEVDPQAPAAPELTPPHCANTQAALDGTGVVWPPMDDELLGRYFDRFVRAGFLPALSHSC